MNSWLPEFGNVTSYWEEYKTKGPRDYSASKHRKNKAVKVSTGSFIPKNTQTKIYYLVAYYKKDE